MLINAIYLLTSFRQKYCSVKQTNIRHVSGRKSKPATATATFEFSQIWLIVLEALMENTSTFAKYTDKAFYAAILLLALAAPLSIAATQIAWALAILFWLIRSFWIRPAFRQDAMSIAVLAFVGLTLVSSFFSYEPQVSLRKMVGVSLVSLVYLVAAAIKDMRSMRRVVAVLLVSAAVTGAYAIAVTALGRNLKVRQLAPESALRAADVQENDTIISANGVKVNSPDELAAAVDSASKDGIAKLRVYRYEVFFDYDLRVQLSGTYADSSARFGIVDWSRGRDVRASGFYGHYTTYAEVVQLIGSLALGLLLLVPGSLFARNRLLLGLILVLLSVGLLLTVTRASWIGFAVSAAVIVFAGASRKVVLICILCAIPVGAAGLYYLQQKRNVAMVDTRDGSTTWRMTVWREGVGVLFSSPRHLAVGIGMDSIKTHWRDWQMFDNGNLPMGHMHSTPLAFAFERGIPTLVVWIVWMFLYLRMLWRGIRRSDLAWFERGTLLGCLGGTAGFLTGGLVHYNWGDSEVVMIFYILMGLSLTVTRVDRDASTEA